MGLPAFAFNSLEFVKELEVAGVSRIQAEAQAHALSKVFEANIKELATKDNLQAVETNLRCEIADLRKDMDFKFTIVDTKFSAIEANLDAKFAAVGARFAAVDTKFAAVDTKLDKLASQMTVRLGSIVLAACTGMPFIFKLFHLL